MNSGPGFDLYGHQNASMQQPNADMVCPHCRGVAGVDPHPEFIFVCKLCGAPRIPGPPDAAGPAFPVLRSVDSMRKKRTGMKALSYAGYAAIGAGVFFALPTALLSGFAALTVLALFGLPGALMAFYGRSQRADLEKKIPAAIDGAWTTTTTELLRSGAVKNSADLARVTRVDPHRAAMLMNLATVEFDTSAAPGTGLRIAEGTVPLPEDPRFAALEQKAATEQQAEAEAAQAETEAAQRNRAAQ